MSSVSDGVGRGVGDAGLTWVGGETVAEVVEQLSQLGGVVGRKVVNAEDGVAQWQAGAVGDWGGDVVVVLSGGLIIVGRCVDVGIARVRRRAGGDRGEVVVSPGDGVRAERRVG
jgi:hypothetical protein